MTINVFLGSNDAFTVSNSNVKVTGASGTGTEAVTIGAGLTGTQLDANVERVNFSGNLSSYTFKSTAGTGVEVRDASSNLILTIPSINTVTKLAFSDGSADMVQTGSSTFTLGGQTVSGTATTAITSSSMGTNWSTTTTSSGTTTGQTFTLTTGVDNIVATSADETIDGSRAVLAGQIIDTLGSADKIDGGAGADTLFVQGNNQSTLGGLTTTPNSLKNVETVQVENLGTTAYTLSLQNSDASVKTVKVGNTTGAAVSVTNIQSALSNLDIDNVNQAVTVTSAAAAIAGAADALAIGLSSVTGALGITAQGYETVTINSNGSVANAPGALVNTSLTTLNIAGSQDVTLTLANTGGTNDTPSLAKIDASTATGKVNVTLDGDSQQALTFTGGTGNDTLDTNGTYGTTDTLNGGAGTDTLVLTNAQAVGTTTTQSNVSNFENLRISALNGTLNANHFGATGLILGADIGGASTVNFAAGTDNVDFRAFDDNAGGVAFTVNVAGTATTDVLNVTAGNATAANGAVGGITWGAAVVTINGAETVNLSSIGGANTFGDAFTITDTAANQSLVITGNQNITFTGAVRADTINASGMTGAATLALNGGTSTTATTITGTGNADTLIGSTAGDIINGGSGADFITNTITGGSTTAGDVLTGGAGYDTFTLIGDVINGGALTNYSSVANITDFTVGASATTTDFLRVSAANTDYFSGTGDGLAKGTTAEGLASGNTMVIQSVGQNAAAAPGVSNVSFIKLTTGVAFNTDVKTTMAAALGTGVVNTLATDAANDHYLVSYYDTTNSKMVLTDVCTNTSTVVADALAAADLTDAGIKVIGTIDMTAADYASFSATNMAVAL